MQKMLEEVKQYSTFGYSESSNVSKRKSEFNAKKWDSTRFLF